MDSVKDTNNAKVVILCGGRGMRFREETEFRPKPLIEIGNRPILWHIMKIYAYYGYKDFVLCLGYKGEMIKNYFINYELMSSNFTIELGQKDKIQVHNNYQEQGWRITFVETGLNAMTGARIKRIEKYIDTDLFMLTYGDGLADLNIDELLKFHLNHSKVGTITGVHPSSRFGELDIGEDGRIVAFSEKPQVKKGYINGGFFVFDRRIFNYVSDEDNCTFERKPLETVSSDGELAIFIHDGSWHCMDTYRDWQVLDEQWNKGSAPWKVWEGK